MKKENRFNIDFIEFSILVEACITPAPIARAMFFQDVSNKYYNILTDNERNRLFDYIQRNNKFDIKDEDCNLFYHRYNPDNQYIITTKHNNKIKKYYCFKYNDHYYISKSTSIDATYITKIEKIHNKNK